MRIGIVAKLKHGDLLAAMQKRGWNQTQMAGFLGMNQSYFGDLINMKWVPTHFSDELEKKLIELTGKTSEQLFPEAFRTREFLSGERVVTAIKDFSPAQLASSGILALPEPMEFKEELVEEIRAVLPKLREKQRVVLEGLLEGYSYEELAQQLGLTKQRVHEISITARKLIRMAVKIRNIQLQKKGIPAITIE